MVAKTSVIHLKYCSNDVVLSFPQYGLNKNNQLIMNRNVPDETVKFFNDLLGFIVTASADRNVTKALCLLLDGAFRIISPQIGGNGESREKLVVMTIDGTLNLGDNFSAASDEFKQCGIILAVVATKKIPEAQYYRALARDTGGQYMSLNDAPVILERVVSAVVREEATFREAFHLANDMNE